MNKIWINGKIVDAQNAISSSDRGFTLGDGIFETMYFDNGNIELFEMHMIRLKSTLSFLYINISYSHNDLINATRKLFEENKLSCGVVRLTVSRGCGKRGIAFDNELKATVVISVSVVDRFQAPVKICTTSYIRNEKSPLSSFKMLNYTDSIMAFNDAKMKGFGDALMLNIKGNVSCTTTANIFLIKGNNLITPSLKFLQLSRHQEAMSLILTVAVAIVQTDNSICNYYQNQTVASFLRKYDLGDIGTS